MTTAPSSTRGTTAPSAARVVHASLGPSSTSFGNLQSRWSKTQIESSPACSARFAKSAVSAKVVIRPSVTSPNAMGTVTPMRIGGV